MYTEREGYLISFFLLDLIWEKDEIQSFLNKDEKDDIGGFLGSMNPFLFSNSIAVDSAYWEDWLRCINSENDDGDYSKDEIIEAEIKFVDYYICNFKFKLSFIKEELIRLRNNAKLKVLEPDDFICAAKKAKEIIESI